jgi:hypothetical protein
MGVKIISLDFDGVIHSYKSGWEGPRTIVDEPVNGALEFIVTALKKYEVHIFSSRSHYFLGRSAMKRWLRKQYFDVAIAGWDYTPEWMQHRISLTAFADPWQDEVTRASRRIIWDINWPKTKPPAHLTIDDRAMQFNGDWPDFEEIEIFKPWNKR